MPSSESRTVNEDDNISDHMATETNPVKVNKMSSATNKSTHRTRNPTTTATTRTTSRSVGLGSSTSRNRSTDSSHSGPLPSSQSTVERTKPVSSSGTTDVVRNGHQERSLQDDTATVPQTAATLAELQRRLDKAEAAAKRYQRQAQSLQQQLDEVKTDKLNDDNQQDLRNDTARVKQLKLEQDQATQNHKSELKEAVADTKRAETKEPELLNTVSRLEAQLALASNATPKHGSSDVSISSTSAHAESEAHILSLQNQLSLVQTKLAEKEHDSEQVRSLENAIIEIKLANTKLMDENESLQMFIDSGCMGATTDYSQKPTELPFSSFASEIGILSTSNDAQLQSELSTLRDQNKALTQYLNNIVTRILQHGELDGILDKDPDLLKGSELLLAAPEVKAAAPSTVMGQGAAAFTGVLQRTRSMMSTTGRTPSKPPVGQRAETIGGISRTANEHPDTAPRIPLNVRAGQRPLSIVPRRGTSDSAATASCSSTLRGRSPSSKILLSPDIMSPQSMSLPSSNRPPSGTRHASNSTVPTISESEESNTIHDVSKRDSKLSSGRNSIASVDSSPPHSTTSSAGEKISGAIMMGSKPRPLRLVREAAEQDEASRKLANRSSWIGWFNKGPGEKPGP